MKFRVQTTSGGEVIFAVHSRQGRPVYYGAPPETGLWRVDVPKFEKSLSDELAQLSFGDSIEEFVFGLEIAELEEWGRWFKETRDYMSYRPKSEQFISVGQVEWKDVKELAVDAQLEQLKIALTVAIERIGTLKRKPRDFDYISFGAAVQESLSRCTSAMVAA
jgi:hypothetical protein